MIRIDLSTISLRTSPVNFTNNISEFAYSSFSNAYLQNASRFKYDLYTFHLLALCQNCTLLTSFHDFQFDIKLALQASENLRRNSTSNFVLSA